MKNVAAATVMAIGIPRMAAKPAMTATAQGVR